MNRIVHFEIQVKDPEQAISFYSKVFGWQISKWNEGNEDYWLISTGKEEPGIDGGLMRSPDGEARTYNTISVSSVDEYIDKVKQNGGEIALPKMAIPGVGWVAYCKDPQGLIFGIYQHDPSVS